MQRITNLCGALFLTTLSLHGKAQVDTPQCGVSETTAHQWREILDRGFHISMDDERNRLALRFADCLADPDPIIRDEIAYAGITQWLRKEQLSDKTRHQLMLTLSAALDAPAETTGFYQPFAALVLSEVIRSDRVDTLFTPAERHRLVDIAVAYVRETRDYRGFNDQDGWRHGVAHGADLLLQLVLNPNVPDKRIVDLVDAAFSQISGHGHAYTFGEPGRLARPILYAAQRQVINAEQWETRFLSLVQPEGRPWEDAYASEQSLIRLHNVRSFLESSYRLIAESEAEALQPVKAALKNTLHELP